MKNSLFKRAFAAAAAVPLALTQCLCVANAVDVNDVAVPSAMAVPTSITLNDGSASALFYIAPDEEGAEYTRVGNTFTKESNWNTKVQTILAQVGNSENKTGTLDASELYQIAIDKSGEFSEVTASLVEKIGELKYSVSDDGKITLTTTLSDITPTFTAGGSNTIGGALKELAEKYGITDLEIPDNFFEGVVIGGDLEVVIDGSALYDGTTVTMSAKFTDEETGKTYYNASIIDWALEKFELLKDTAKNTCAKYEEYGLDLTDAEKQIDDSVSFYVNKLETAKTYVDKALGASRTASASSIQPILERIDNKLQASFGKSLPGTTGAEIAANSTVLSVYDNIFNQLVSKTDVDVDITAADFGALADELYDITASTNNGLATISGKIADAEEAAVVEYIESTYNLTVDEVYKEVTVTVDFSAVKAGDTAASVTMDLQRVVEASEPEVTTTSVTETTPTDTETTPTDTETTPTDTETTPTDTETIPTDTETTPTDTETTPTDTGTTPTDTETTPTDTETTPTDTETTPTDTETTTRTETVSVVNFHTEASVGFYLDVDKEFNADQIQSIGYSLESYVVSYGEDGIEIDRVPVEDDTIYDITDLVEFKDVPAEVLAQAEKNQFAHDIALYAKETITAADGTVVANAGEALEGVIVKAYIGVKGDADFDMTADSSDASTVLVYYAKRQTSASGSDIQFSTNTELVEADPMLDEFAAFLCDVDNENDVNNWNMLKSERTIESSDASFIMVYYAAMQTGKPAGRDTWNEALGSYGKN